MASKSGGKISDAEGMVADANQAIAILSTLHHWSCSKQNGEGRPRYDVSITHAGRRVSATRSNFVDAAIAALQKIKGKEPPMMRLAK